MRHFTRKGHGRIYVEHLNDVQNVANIIKEMDEFEFEYLPDYFITSYDQFPEVIYTGKFDDLDLDLLTFKCSQKGIYIFCFDNGLNEFTNYEKVKK